MSKRILPSEWALLMYAFFTVVVCYSCGMPVTPALLNVAIVVKRICACFVIAILPAYIIIDLICNRLFPSTARLMPDRPKDNPDVQLTALKMLTNVIWQIMGPRFWRGLFTIMGIFLCYSHLKAVIPLASLTDSWDAYFWNLDNMIINGITPLRLDIIDKSSQMLSFFSIVYHSIGFLYPFVLGALLLRFHSKTFEHTVLALFFTYFMGNVLYFIFPCDGPVFYRPELYEWLPDGIIVSSQQFLVEFRNMFIENPGSYNVQLFNGIAGFPSLHIAQSIVLLWAVWQKLPRLLPLVIIYQPLVVLSTLIFGWHYLVDDIAGLIIACLAIIIAGKLIPKDLNDGNMVQKCS